MLGRPQLVEPVAVEADLARAVTLRAGSRPMIERDSTDLPQPDSPTIPSVRPRSSVNDTPSTALHRARGVC